jgi:hypothetical protein
MVTKSFSKDTDMHMYLEEKAKKKEGNIEQGHLKRWIKGWNTSSSLMRRK